MKTYAVPGLARAIALFSLILVAAVACARGAPTPPEEDQKPLPLSSPAFRDEEPIPVKYTCQGQDASPPLTWSEPPQGAQSFALIMDDPDASGKVFTHWLLFNLPRDSRELAEAIPPQEQLTSGALQGNNDFG